MSNLVSVKIALGDIIKGAELDDVVYELVELYTPYYSESAKGVRVRQVTELLEKEWPICKKQ